MTRAIRQSGGFLDDAAETLGVSRRTLQRWINEDERLAKARELAAGPGMRKPSSG